MYFTASAALDARLATLEHYESMFRILLDSAGHLVKLYTETGSNALGRARGGEFRPDSAHFQVFFPELFVAHLRIAGHAHESLVLLAEAQLHNVDRLAKFALDKTARMSPPLVEQAIDTAESLLSVGENAADELCEASLKAVAEGEEKLDGASRARKKIAS